MRKNMICVLQLLYSLFCSVVRTPSVSIISQSLLVWHLASEYLLLLHHPGPRKGAGFSKCWSLPWPTLSQVTAFSSGTQAMPRFGSSPLLADTRMSWLLCLACWQSKMLLASRCWPQSRITGGQQSPSLDTKGNGSSPGQRTDQTLPRFSGRPCWLQS